MARYIVDSPDPEPFTAVFPTKAAALEKAASLTMYASVGVLLERKGQRDEEVAVFNYGIKVFEAGSARRG